MTGAASSVSASTMWQDCRFCKGRGGGVSVVTLEDYCSMFIAENLSGMTVVLYSVRAQAEKACVDNLLLSNVTKASFHGLLNRGGCISFFFSWKRDQIF